MGVGFACGSRTVDSEGGFDSRGVEVLCVEFCQTDSFF